MSLPTPNLDDRTFQDLVDEAKRMIPRYCPEWTDHNVSDPGVTLIELFAWMVDILLYRLNRVPEKNQITFLELMGVKLQPALPARVALTFTLSSPAEEALVIPRGTQAGTQQAPNDPSVTFTTDRDLRIEPPTLIGCFTSPNERVFDDQLWKLTDPDQSFLVFSPRPRPGDALYLGFSTPIEQLSLSLQIDSSVEGIGIDPSHPPLAWEVWTGSGWQVLSGFQIERDGTGGFNQAGELVLHIPGALQQQNIEGLEAWWLRCVYIKPESGQQTYSSSPAIRSIRTAALGGTINATHSTEILNTILGRSDGTPGQQFGFDYTPVLPRRPEEVIEVQKDDTTWEAWDERETFALSNPIERHYTLDDVSGTLRFGPSIREPDGTTRQYGAIPERDRLIRMNRYRTGGGVHGNVGAGTISVLQSAVPYVDKVINRTQAAGGRDAETIERAALRAPQTLKTRFRAVTAEDYEYLAMKASTDVARVLCSQPSPDELRPDDPNGLVAGTVYVYIVPREDAARVERHMLELAPSLVSSVRDYLDERRLLTTRLEIREPSYIPLAVTTRIRAGMLVDSELLRQDIERLLYQYLHPIFGGPDGTGWPFGRTLYAAELYALLQSVPGVKYVEEISLSTETAENESMIEIPAAGLFLARDHTVSVRQ